MSRRTPLLRQIDDTPQVVQARCACGVTHQIPVYAADTAMNAMREKLAAADEDCRNLNEYALQLERQLHEKDSDLADLGGVNKRLEHDLSTCDVTIKALNHEIHRQRCENERLGLQIGESQRCALETHVELQNKIVMLEASLENSKESIQRWKGEAQRAQQDSLQSKKRSTALPDENCCCSGRPHANEQSARSLPNRESLPLPNAAKSLTSTASADTSGSKALLHELSDSVRLLYDVVRQLRNALAGQLPLIDLQTKGHPIVCDLWNSANNILSKAGGSLDAPMAEEYFAVSEPKKLFPRSAPGAVVGYTTPSASLARNSAPTSRSPSINPIQASPEAYEDAAALPVSTRRVPLQATRSAHLQAASEAASFSRASTSVSRLTEPRLRLLHEDARGDLCDEEMAPRQKEIHRDLITHQPQDTPSLTFKDPNHVAVLQEQIRKLQDEQRRFQQENFKLTMQLHSAGAAPSLRTQKLQLKSGATSSSFQASGVSSRYLRTNSAKH